MAGTAFDAAVRRQLQLVEAPPEHALNGDVLLEVGAMGVEELRLAALNDDLLLVGRRLRLSRRRAPGLAVPVAVAVLPLPTTRPP